MNTVYQSIAIICLISIFTVAGFATLENRNKRSILNVVTGSVISIILTGLILFVLTSTGVYEPGFSAILSFMLAMLFFSLLTFTAERVKRVRIYALILAALLLCVPMAVSFDKAALVVTVTGVVAAVAGSAFALLMNLRK